MNAEKILTTPQLERTLALARDCLGLNCLGMLSGPSGTGKTVALQAVESRYSTLSDNGKPLYLRCCIVQGPTRGIKDILDSIGIRASLLPPNATLQSTIKLALRELHSRQIRLLLLDEADSWGLDSLEGVVSLYDWAAQRNQPISLLLAGTSDMVKWLGNYTSGLSRTLRCESFTPMSPELMLGVLREWDDRFAALASKVEAKDKEALALVKLVHKATSGSFRRLNYFARLMALSPSDRIDRLPVQSAPWLARVVLNADTVLFLANHTLRMVHRGVTYQTRTNPN